MSSPTKTAGRSFGATSPFKPSVLPSLQDTHTAHHWKERIEAEQRQRTRPVAVKPNFLAHPTSLLERRSDHSPTRHPPGLAANLHPAGVPRMNTQHASPLRPYQAQAQLLPYDRQQQEQQRQREIEEQNRQLAAYKREMEDAKRQQVYASAFAQSAAGQRYGAVVPAAQSQQQQPQQRTMKHSPSTTDARHRGQLQPLQQQAQDASPSPVRSMAHSASEPAFATSFQRNSALPALSPARNGQQHSHQPNQHSYSSNYSDSNSRAYSYSDGDDQQQQGDQSEQEREEEAALMRAEQQYDEQARVQEVQNGDANGADQRREQHARGQSEVRFAETNSYAEPPQSHEDEHQQSYTQSQHQRGASMDRQQQQQSASPAKSLSALDRQRQQAASLQQQAHLLPVAGTRRGVNAARGNISTSNFLEHKGQTAEKDFYASHTNTVYQASYHPSESSSSAPPSDVFRSETENSANYAPPPIDAHADYLARQQAQLAHKMRSETHLTPHQYFPSNYAPNANSTFNVSPARAQATTTKLPALHSPQR